MSEMEIEMDKKELSIGDAIHNLNESDHVIEEKKRIYLLLKDKESPSALRTIQWCLVNKDFERFSSTKTRDIHGFRPQSKMFKEKAYLLLLKEMKQSQDLKYWRFYESAYIDYLRKNKVELRDLLDKEKMSKQLSSDDLIKMVITLAPKYNVPVEDIVEIYENWYFIQNPNIGLWLQDLERETRSLKNKNDIEGIEKEISGVKSEIDSISNTIVTNESIDNKIRPITLELKSIKENLEDESQRQALDLVEISNRIELLVIELENKNKVVNVSISKTKSILLDKINDHMKAIEEQLEKDKLEVEIKIDSLDTGASKNTNVPNSSVNLIKNKTIHNNLRDVSVTEDIEEGLFLERYRKLLEAERFSMTEKEAALNHSILKCSKVINCKSLDCVDPWIRGLGWESHVLEAAVDPNWTNYKAWQDVATEFLSNKKIRILILHSYNVGYVEGYLAPFLLLYNREKYQHKKIILVESQTIENVNRIGNGFSLLETKSLKLTTFKDLEKEAFNSISLKAYDEWLLKSNEESEDSAQLICMTLMEYFVSENIRVSNYFFITLQLILVSYFNNGSGLDSKTKSEFLSKILPSFISNEVISKLLQEL